jgi:acyl-CoA synthetase (AMP-forming)/AMP-acid ligase II
MNIILSFDRALALWPDRQALIDGAVSLTYRQFAERVFRLANALTVRGITRGSVVALLAPNCHEFMEAYYACALLGAVANPINVRLSTREIALILEDSQARALICHEDLGHLGTTSVLACPEINVLLWIGTGSPPEIPVETCRYEPALEQAHPERPALAPCSAEDLAQLYYTSGTTGKPKGVMLTHGNVTFHALAAIADLRLSDADTWAHVAPMFHLADAWATFAVTWVGGKHVFVPYFNAAQVLATIERERVTISNLVPTMLTALINDPQAADFDYSSLRVLLSGGAPIAPETVRRIVATFGCDYIQTYGMTETSPYLTVSVLKEHLTHLSSDRQLQIKSRTGRPFIGVELQVVRADGREVAWNDAEVGEIVVRGPTVTPGYWRQEEATAEAIKNGWLHTGDLAVIDQEGYVNIVDRKKDTIITGGENVYSTEVEHVLYEHPAVLECAVIGVPDAHWGESVKAIVVTRDGLSVTADQLIAFARERLAHYKCPRSVDFVPELPKTGSGKIMKKALKQAYLEQTGAN